MISSTVSVELLDYRYGFGGVRLQSNIAFEQLRPDLVAVPTAPAFTVRVVQGQLPPADRILCRWSGRYGLTLGVIGDDWLFRSALDGAFRIARDVIHCSVDDPDGLAWRDVLIRRVLPRVAILAGASAVHAAAVATRGRAVLLLGPSGAGKSTLCAALSQAGWDVLGDDVALLWRAPTAHVAPATTGICLWPDSRRALGVSDTQSTPLPAYQGKAHVASANDGGTGLVPLTALVFLTRTPDALRPSLHRLGAAEGMIRTLHQRVRFNPAGDSGNRATDSRAALHSIVAATPCYQLTYPDDLAATDAVAATLRDLTDA